MERELIIKALYGGVSFTIVWWIISYLLNQLEFWLGIIGGTIFALTWLILQIITE